MRRISQLFSLLHIQVYRTNALFLNVSENDQLHIECSLEPIKLTGNAPTVITF